VNGCIKPWRTGSIGVGACTSRRNSGQGQWHDLLAGHGHAGWHALVAGGVVSLRRDRSLAERLLAGVRRCAQNGCRVLVITDGWAAYPNAILRAFRTKVAREGRAGRCRLQVWATLGIAVVIKHTSQQGIPLLRLTRRILRGTAAFVAQQLTASHGGLWINTAYLERLNGAFRERLAILTRRCRHAAKRQETVHAAMFLLGTIYNFCMVHHAFGSRTLTNRSNRVGASKPQPWPAV
jgi:hypothetical protein